MTRHPGPRLTTDSENHAQLTTRGLVLVVTPVDEVVQSLHPRRLATDRVDSISAHALPGPRIPTRNKALRDLRGLVANIAELGDDLPQLLSTLKKIRTAPSDASASHG